MEIGEKKEKGAILKVAEEWDHDNELQIDILNEVLPDASIWLTKEEVKKLIQHLISVFPCSQTIDEAYLTSKLNESDPSKRWYPTDEI